MREHAESRTSARREFLKRATVGSAAVGLAALVGVPPARARQDSAEKVGRQAVDKLIAGWPAKPQEVTKAMVEKYGPPDEATPSHLVWHKNGPWKCSIVYRDEVPHYFPVKHTDLLDQAIDYRVPPEKCDELAEFDGAVTVRITKGEMAAMCDREDMNFLALNLAHEIITGKRTVEDARQFQAKTVIAYRKGEKHPYTQKFVFEVPKGGTGYPDHEANKE